MGKTITPKYRVEFRDNDRNAWSIFKRQIWDCKAYGKPTAKNLATWREKMNTSFDNGGVNFHISKAAGFIVYISHAKIVSQKSGEIVAEYTMPMFEVA